MLILPVVNKNKVMNIEVKLKDVSKIRSNFYSDTIPESDILVNRAKYSDSSYYYSKDDSAIIDFIRNRSLMYPRRFTVTTKSRVHSNSYDVYEVPQPPKKVYPQLDQLYIKTILDLKNEIPEKTKRGRYVSFKDLGLDSIVTDERIIQLQKIVSEEKDSSKWFDLFQKNDVLILEDALRYIQKFEYTLLSEYSISENSLQDCLKVFDVLHTRDYRHLNKYYQMALDNAVIYTRLSYVHKLLFHKPLSLIQRDHSNLKQLVKRKDEADYE